MAIPGISPNLLATAFIPPATSAPSVSSSITPEDLLTVTMAVYLSQLHAVVMQSWQKFAESTQEQAEANNDAHRSREVRQGQEEASRLEGQLRHVDVIRDTPTEDVLFPDGVTRQAGKMRFHQASYTGDSDRHLNLPV